jgi:uncharacterized protein YkwD
MPTLPALGTIRRSVTTLAVGVALLFSFALNPGSASAAPSATDAATWTVSLFKALNAQRAGWHLPALLSNAGLANVAHGHNLKMAAYDRVLHQLPGELAPRTRIARLGFSATIAGENLAQTTDSTWAGTYAQQRAMYYSVSDGRRANILSSAYRYVGVDVAVDLVHHKLWITEEFGVTAPPVYAVPATVSMASEMLRLMNAERAVHGRAALRMNAALVRSAHYHNLRMASANSMSHLLPGELGFLARLLQVGYSPRAAGENIAWNSNWTLDGVLYLQRLMYNEVAPNDAHRVNILSPTYREVGVDVYFDTAHHKVWITQDLGLAA